MKPEEVDRINRQGRAAEELLNSASLQSAFNDILEAQTKRWLATNEREIREREECHLLVRGVQAVLNELKDRRDSMVKLNSELSRKEQLKRVI